MNFKEWFEKSGMTATALARTCKISRNTVNNLLKGITPSFKTLSRMISMTRMFTIPITQNLWNVDKIKGMSTRKQVREKYAVEKRKK